MTPGRKLTLSASLTITASLVTLVTFGQIANPMPQKIETSGLTYQLEPFASIQRTSGVAPKARINMLRELPDGSGRMGVNDLRGLMWVLDHGLSSLYLNLFDYFDDFIHQPGKGTGFGAFAFHPDFLKNGLFYTAHSEKANAAPADFSPFAYQHISLQWVVTEWQATSTSANTFEGTHRELLRMDYPDVLHGIQEITFNPTVSPGDPDYGLLYICVGEGGSSINFLEENIQTISSYLGTIFRIDPLGTNSVNGKYGYPADNPFVGVPDALPEIWAYGFRNPHRICWDPAGDHRMLIADIGEKNLEEVNIGLKGANYGWGVREGTFVYRRTSGREFVYPLPADDSIYGYTYPVAQFDHDEGLAIVGGFVYRGQQFPELTGNYIFGDIPSGRLFRVPVDSLQTGRLANIEEINLHTAQGNATSLLKLVGGDRVDLRFGVDADGEFYILTKGDGMIRRFVNQTTSTRPIQLSDQWSLYPNPGHQSLHIRMFQPLVGPAVLRISSLDGKTIIQKALRSTQEMVDVANWPAGVYLVRVQTGRGILTGKWVKAR